MTSALGPVLLAKWANVVGRSGIVAAGTAGARVGADAERRFDEAELELVMEATEGEETRRRGGRSWARWEVGVGVGRDDLLLKKLKPPLRWAGAVPGTGSPMSEY